MTNEDLQLTVFESLRRVAPEADASKIARDVDLRDELDIDSMDFLNFVTALHERLGVDIPEADYPKVRTLDTCLAYLAAKLAR